MRLADLLIARRHRAAPPATVPGLAPEPTPNDRRRPRRGVVLRRIGGQPAYGATGSFPRIAGIAAVRGFVLAASAVRSVELRLDGRRIRVAPVTPGAPDAAGLRKHVFNVWHDFSDVAPGPHRLSIRPPGLFGRLRERGRRVTVLPPGTAPTDSDAEVAIPPGDRRTLEDAIAALPSMVRPARRAVLPDPVRSILLLRADQLGDMAISIPAIRRLRQLFPDAGVTGLVTADNADLAHACGLFDAVIVAPFVEDAALGRRVLAEAAQESLRATLAARSFDLAIDLGEGAQSRLLLLLSGARFLYGFRHGDHPWLSAAFELNARDPANGLEVIPPARKLMAMVDALGAMRAAAPDPLPRTAPDDDALAAYGVAPGERYVVLHTGARLAHSRWPHFAELARLLLARTDLSVLLFAHAGAAPDPVALPPDQARRLHRIEGKVPFAAFDAILSRCAVMIGNDSGPKHLAALRGAKVVSLHMARLNWNEWGQEGEGLIVSRRVPCAGCGIGDDAEECGRDFPCLTGITAEEVCAAVIGLL